MLIRWVGSVGGGEGDERGDAGSIWGSSAGKRGAFLHARLVEDGGRGVRVRRLGRDRAGEIRITRFLRNPAVSVAEMVATAAARTCSRVAGRHVLAIQDTTTVRAAAEGRCVALHPVIAVDAIEGTLLGLVDARLLVREGGMRAQRKERCLAQKQSRRWLDGAERAAAPGRRARTAVLSLRFCTVDIARPLSRQTRAELARLPRSVRLRLVEAREIDPPGDAPPAHWRLLTTHAVADAADARRIVGFYRQRWTIEQLFRTLKTQGFDVEALRLAGGGPFEKLVTASLIAAVSVLQLVRERDGGAKRPLEDAFDPDDRPVLETLSASLEGKTARQKNPHPKGSLAFAAWTLARLGGWTGYYGKPGPVVMLAGLVQFHAVKHGWTLHDV